MGKPADRYGIRNDGNSAPSKTAENERESLSISDTIIYIIAYYYSIYQLSLFVNFIR